MWTSWYQGISFQIWIDEVYFVSPYDNFPQLDFVCYFEPRDYGSSAYSEIDETTNHPYTVFIAQEPYFFIITTADNLGPHHIPNILFMYFNLRFIFDSYPPVVSVVISGHGGIS